MRPGLGEQSKWGLLRHEALAIWGSKQKLIIYLERENKFLKTTLKFLTNTQTLQNQEKSHFCWLSDIPLLFFYILMACALPFHIKTILLYFPQREQKDICLSFTIVDWNLFFIIHSLDEYSCGLHTHCLYYCFQLVLYKHRDSDNSSILFLTIPFKRKKEGIMCL